MQPLEEKMEQQQEQLEQNEEMEQAQEQEQLEETPQDDAPEGYRIDFAVRYVEIFEGLEATDKADGTNKKPKRLFVILTLLMCAQVIWYAYSGNGFALVFAIVLGAMALVLRNSYQKANRAIAKAFEEEGDQRVIVGEEKLYLNEKEVAYSEIAHCYQLKHCFSIVYQGNHVYVIPKSVLNVEQAQELASLMQQKAPQAYHDLTQK